MLMAQRRPEQVVTADKMAPGAVLVVDATAMTAFGDHLDASLQRHAQALREAGALMLDCSTEGPAFHAPSWETLHAVLAHHGVQPNRVVYLTNNHAFRGRPDPADGGVVILPQNYFFRSVVNGIVQQLANPARREARMRRLSPISNSQRSARFLCLNHRMRGHRLVVVGRIARLGLLERGHVSVLLDDSPNPAVSLGKALADAREFFPAFENDLAAFANLTDRLPLTIPVDDSANRISSVSVALYEQSWFSLVNETEMTLGSIARFTEKTVKPIAGAHPALVCGNPGTLALLRHYGFETFSPLLDETYDSIHDRQDRLAAVLSEFERLATMPDNEIARLAAELWPVHEANMQHIERTLPGILDAEENAVIAALRAAGAA